MLLLLLLKHKKLRTLLLAKYTFFMSKDKESTKNLSIYKQNTSMFLQVDDSVDCEGLRICLLALSLRPFRVSTTVRLRSQNGRLFYVAQPRWSIRTAGQKYSNSQQPHRCTGKIVFMKYCLFSHSVDFGIGGN